MIRYRLNLAAWHAANWVVRGCRWLLEKDPDGTANWMGVTLIGVVALLVTVALHFFAGFVEGWLFPNVGRYDGSDGTHWGHHSRFPWWSYAAIGWAAVLAFGGVGTIATLTIRRVGRAAVRIADSPKPELLAGPRIEAARGSLSEAQGDGALSEVEPFRGRVTLGGGER